MPRLEAILPVVFETIDPNTPVPPARVVWYPWEKQSQLLNDTEDLPNATPEEPFAPRTKPQPKPTAPEETTP